MGDLGEAAALLRVEVDVVNVERGSNQAAGVDGVDNRGVIDICVAQVANLVELEVNLDLVVLESNQRKSKARVAVEPELQGNVESVLREAATKDFNIATVDNRLKIFAVADNIRTIRGKGRNGLDLSALSGRVCLNIASIAVSPSVSNCNTAKAVHHGEVVTGLACGERELIPDVEPVAIVLVDALAANLELNGVNEVLANEGNPGEICRAFREVRRIDSREGHLEVDTGNQVAVTGDCARDTLAEVGDTVEGLLDGLHREVGVSAVQLLEEGNLRVRREVNVLCTIGD